MGRSDPFPDSEFWGLDSVLLTSPGPDTTAHGGTSISPLKGPSPMAEFSNNQIEKLQSLLARDRVSSGLSNREAGRFELFFAPDPGADATIGGMIANNASGVQTVKYGATKDYVMRRTVVLPAGDAIRTESSFRKNS
jgi:hypothetical protein